MRPYYATIHSDISSDEVHVIVRKYDESGQKYCLTSDQRWVRVAEGCYLLDFLSLHIDDAEQVLRALGDAISNFHKTKPDAHRPPPVWGKSDLEAALPAIKAAACGFGITTADATTSMIPVLKSSAEAWEEIGGPQLAAARKRPWWRRWGR